MRVYNMSKYAQMCEEPCLRKCYHIWTDITHLQSQPINKYNI
jgi:hypothetical protein